MSITLTADLKPHKNVILIIGSPRSGTTWLMEILGEMPGYKTIFEPFNPVNYPRIPVSIRPFIQKDEKNEKLLAYFDDLFNDKVKSKRVQYRVNLKNISKRIFAKNLIIKSVRICRLIPWILENISNVQIIYVVRNPISVVKSQLKTTYTGYPEGVPTSEELIKDAKKMGYDFNFELQTIEEKLAFIWALDQLAVKDTHGSNLLKIDYDEFISNKKLVLEKILLFLDKKHCFDDLYGFINRPSRLTSDKEFTLTENQKDNIKNILNLCGIKSHSDFITN